MNKDLLLDNRLFVSVSHASKKMGYTADYLGQLCRAGKIEARMIGRTWYVEWESLKNHKKTKLHRIRRTAAEIKKAKEEFNSSQNSGGDIKITQNVDCPPEEYLEKIDTQIHVEKNVENVIENNQINFPIISNEVVVEKNISDCPSPEYLKKIDDALPINYSSENWLPVLTKKNIQNVSSEKIISPYHNHFVSIGILSLFILLNLTFVSLSIFSPQSTTKISDSISKIDVSFLNPNTKSLTLNTLETSRLRNTSSAFGGVKDFFGFIFGSIKQKIDYYALSYKKSLGIATPEIDQNEPKQPITKGMVVVPDDKNHEATVASIKKTFSDEVSVKPDSDEESGVIVPHFREADGETYTYVLIPINSP